VSSQFFRPPRNTPPSMKWRKKTSWLCHLTVQAMRLIVHQVLQFGLLRDLLREHA
jgi:hypothetical protein